MLDTAEQVAAAAERLRTRVLQIELQRVVVVFSSS
jgi:hypothetical protein